MQAGVGMTDAAFNNLMQEWLNQIQQLIKKLKTIPDSEREVLLKKHKEIIDIFLGFKNSTNADDRRKPMEIFMGTITSNPLIEQLIYQKDEELWTQKYSSSIPLISVLHLDKHWKTFPEKTKHGMWEFLNMLLMLGKTIMMIPKEALPQVEQFATQILGNREWTEGIINNDPNTQQAMLKGMFETISKS